MKIMFVVGGSYKGFYLNQLIKNRRLDFLFFHQNIFYEYDIEKERLGLGVVKKELLELNDKFQCPILVYGKILKNGNLKKCFILCRQNRVKIIDENNCIYLYTKKQLILISNKSCGYSKADINILIKDKMTGLDCINKNEFNNLFICHKKGVIYLKNNKIYKKFRKCCYFTLNFS